MKKNHKKSKSIWMGFNKRALDKNSFSAIQAFDIILSYGWTSTVMSGIDHLSYKLKIVPRKSQSVWSPKNIKRFLELRKKGLIQPAGEKAYAERNQKKEKQSEQKFSAAQLKQFKFNNAAWTFFNSQAPGYRKYMEHWVASAKRKKTQVNRLNDLIRDSGNGTKLQRILDAQEKFRNRFPAGKMHFKN